MAAPIVDSVTPPGPLTLSPGQQVDVVIAAHDPDSASGEAVIPVTDTQGNSTPVTVLLSVNDPISFGTATVTGVAVTVQRITAAGVSPATYRFTAS